VAPAESPERPVVRDALKTDPGFWVVPAAAAQFYGNPRNCWNRSTSASLKMT